MYVVKVYFKINFKDKIKAKYYGYFYKKLLYVNFNARIYVYDLTL